MSYQEIMRLALERGFFSPSCDIYSDAPAGFWDYGPLGVGFRNRFVELWRREIVRRDGMLEIDGSQIMSRSVFEASGHLKSFSDPITKCTRCGSVHRADRLITEQTGRPAPESLPDEELTRMMAELHVVCPSCKGVLGPISRFNMMFRTFLGPAGDEVYLRPETCQSIFVDFPRYFKIMRRKLPVAIAQFGKSFRNEIAPRQGLMRLREFYQAEVEVFFNPDRANDHPPLGRAKDVKLRILDSSGREAEQTAEEAVDRGVLPNKLMAYYLALLTNFYSKTGIDMSRSRFRELDPKDRAFYAANAFDFEVSTSLGWVELVACNYRTSYDLERHGEISKKEIRVDDDGLKVIPHVFELSMGVDRSLYCILEHSFRREKERDLLAFPPYLAPVQVVVLPLMAKDGLDGVAKEIHERTKIDFESYLDTTGSIGRRYRRADEIGVPFAVTVDYQTLQEETVTVRKRDGMTQERVRKDDLLEFLGGRLSPN